jgi:nucleoid-associated protein YgaU
MYQNEIRELPRLKNENYENIFSVYQDNDNRYFYNLLQTLHFPENLPDSYFNSYTTGYNDTLPVISFRVYGDIRLWWVITHANKIVNPTAKISPGIILKIPKPEIVTEILTQLITQQS